MDRIAILCFIFCLTKICQASHPSGVARRNVSNNTSAEERYYNLLGALQAAISHHRGTSKTSNVGVALSDRQDLLNNYPGKPARHCADIYKAGYHRNGVYTISPPGVTNLEVYCDMSQRLGKNGGWTVFQKRLDGKVDFYRDWAAYRRGFGDVRAEHWLGLENIYLLTHSEPMQLFIYLEDFDGNSRWAHYDSFSVASEFSKYRLDFGTYMGTAGNALTVHRGQPFSSKDQDNDSHNYHCAEKFKAPWWHEGCYDSSLNGQYLNGARNDYLGIQWRVWRDKYSLKTAIMMMKPVYDN